MKNLPIGIQTFSKIINNNLLYVDKTEIIYQLLNGKRGSYFFLSRPRRFGKSLLVSTLKEIFLNNRALFKSLWIDSSDYSWKYYPVIHIDFSTISRINAKQLEQGILDKLIKLSQEYNIIITYTSSITDAFENLVQELYKKFGPVVILIDEYDKPILDHIENKPFAYANQAILRDFYAAIKSADEYIKFIFMTGITKFSKTSVFSGLNNLVDLTLDSDFATLLGYTENDISKYFIPYVNQIAQKKNNPNEKILDKMRFWYNGYQFSDLDIKVYNPFSILLFLARGNFFNYWFETGTPSFLINLIKQKQYQIKDLDKSELNILETSSFELDNIQLASLLFQTGYLTISSYDDLTSTYTLTYPNEETKISFFHYFISNWTTTSIAQINNHILKLTNALRYNDINLFFDLLKVFFADIPYNIQIPKEKYYQSIFYIINNLIGAYIQTEVTTNYGRIDSVISTDKIIYLFEFKIDDNSQHALEQIEEKKYYQKYLYKNKKIMLIGVNFDTKQKNIENWVIKEL